MRTLFGDTSWLVAISAQRDQHHAPAMALSAKLGRYRLVTTEFVMAEFLNTFAAMHGTWSRMSAVSYLRQLQAHPDVMIVPATSDLFWAGVALYEARSDKPWSLVDCTSFVLMEQQDIAEALTFDRDFAQAGFTILP
ncbi:MAG TPA: PIN domain-containing protein [bacterium]|nr:PIN domain-containing protein [bacterium]